MVLHALKDSALDTLFAKAEKKSYSRRDVIFRRGDPGTSLIVVKSGQAEISVTTSLGHKSIMGTARTDDIIGDIACLDGGPRSADVVALEKMEVLVIYRRDVMEVLRNDPDSAQMVIEELCKKTRNASDMIELRSLVDSGARMAMCILRLVGDEDEEGYDPTVRVSQGWLGEYAGLSRENVNRQLQVWNKEGVISIEKGVLSVVNREVLEDIALEGSNQRRGGF